MVMLQDYRAPATKIRSEQNEKRHEQQKRLPLHSGLSHACIVHACLRCCVVIVVMHCYCYAYSCVSYCYIVLLLLVVAVVAVVVAVAVGCLLLLGSNNNNNNNNTRASPDIKQAAHARLKSCTDCSKLST